VRVGAARVGPEVWHLMTGRPYFVRLMGFGLRAPKARIPGRDLAGIVEAVGSGVSGFRPGDEVFGSCRGSFAEYAVATAALDGDRVSALEDCRHISGSLERFLIGR
jgi:NADPH:quinone reductase-like Zn-dependent oxidoreductase